MEENKGQILLYQTPDGEARIEVRLQGETVWLNLDQMAELFQRNKSTISRHIRNVFEEGELRKETTVAKFATVVNRGIRGEVEDQIVYYNLDMIISVGYRVHSYRGVQFRMWATRVLKEYIVKGFALNDDLLKTGDIFPQVIQDYINSADLFVLFCSENASKSEYVDKERKQALERAFPQVKPQQEAKLSIYPMSIEPRAELPSDMKENYHFGEI